MTIGLIGKKLGMTQRFFENGESLPVTVLKIEKAKVVDVVEKEKRGYSAVLVGYGHVKNMLVMSRFIEELLKWNERC